MATFKQHIDINAPVDNVWSILMNPSQWPLWFPGITGLSNLSAVQTGATFQWQDGDKTGSGSIAAVDENRGLIHVITSEGDAQISHTFDLDRAGGFLGLGGNHTRLTYQREYDTPGGFLGEFVAGGNPADLLKVKHTLEKVKQLAEG
jgi:uncharacterized protein YndB with AHSA1/START domain